MVQNDLTDDNPTQLGVPAEDQDQLNSLKDRAMKIEADMRKKEVVENEFVNQYFEMDPETEDVLPSGAHLMNGMKVILEDSAYRLNLAQLGRSSEATELIRRWNRWATVSHLDISRPERGQRFGEVQFVAIYDDGTKKSICVSERAAWFVKKASIEAAAKQEAEEDKMFEEGLRSSFINLPFKVTQSIVEFWAGFYGYSVIADNVPPTNDEVSG